LLNVFLTHKNAEVRGSMLGYITDYNTAATERISMLTQNYLSKGFSAEDAQMAAYKAMEGMLYKQQALVAYDQGFFAVGISILICIPIVLLIRYKKGVPAKPIADH